MRCAHETSARPGESPDKCRDAAGASGHVRPPCLPVLGRAGSKTLMRRLLHRLSADRG